MPETRLQKTRASLPEGYQFGDAKPPVPVGVWLTNVEFFDMIRQVLNETRRA